MEKILINEMDNELRIMNEKYNNFVSREDFINRTGIFVTPEYFNYIYNVEYCEEARESGVSVAKFIRDYEEMHPGEVVEVPLEGTFKYLVHDYASSFCEYEPIYDPNIWEIVNSLARSAAQEHISKIETVEEYKKLVSDMMDVIERMQMEIENPISDLLS